MVAQLVKNPPVIQRPPAVQETWVRSLGQEHLLEKEMATHSSILAWEIPDRGAWRATVHGFAVRRDVATTPPPPLLKLNIYRSHTLHSWKCVSAHIRNVCRFTVKMCSKMFSITIYSNHKLEISQMPYEPVNE